MGPALRITVVLRSAFLSDKIAGAAVALTIRMLSPTPKSPSIPGSRSDKRTGNLADRRLAARSECGRVPAGQRRRPLLRGIQEPP